jgi:hypothetical protein
MGLNFDLYGRDLPDWADSHGKVGMKWSSMAPYYYNLAIENYADNDWYVSEKLLGCFAGLVSADLLWGTRRR